MNNFKSMLSIALLSAVYVFSCHVFATDESSGSSAFTKVYSCSELTSCVDREICSFHLFIFKDLISKLKNPATPEIVEIRKISATKERLGHEVFATEHPTLFIFDAEHSPGQPAVYELPLTEGSGVTPGTVKSFQLPDNSAFVGNSVDILPEFVTEGGMQSHYVMSAVHNDSVYYLANIEIDSRNPLETAASSTSTSTSISTATSPTPTPTISSTSMTASAEYPTSTPTKKPHIPEGVLNLRGAGIFVSDNIRVVLDPADNRVRVNTVELGCTNHADGRGTEEHFIYRFMHSEFDLRKGMQRPTDFHSAALNIECYQHTGQILLAMKNTKTVIPVPGRVDFTTPGSLKSTNVLFSMSLSSRENILSFDDSTCNSIVDQFGNDLSIDPANPSDPDHYMGSVYGSNFCSDVKMIKGAFGLKDRALAWGSIPVEHSEKEHCWKLHEESYRAGLAPLRTWSEAGFDLACQCVPTCTQYAFSPNSCSASTLAPYPNPDAGALVSNTTVTSGLTKKQKAGIGVGVALVVDQAITQSWFHLSNRIRQARIRRTSQALAIALGLGVPMVQLLPRCISGLRGKKGGHRLLTGEMTEQTVP